MGVRLGGEFDPGDFVTLPGFLGEEGKRKDVRAVDEPTGTKNVEHIEDAVDVNGSREWCLGDARSSPAPGVVAYGGTRQESRGGREGTHLRHTRDDGGKRTRRWVGKCSQLGYFQVKCGQQFYW